MNIRRHDGFKIVNGPASQTNDRAGLRPLLHAVPQKATFTANFIAGPYTAESKLRLRGKMLAKDGYIARPVMFLNSDSVYLAQQQHRLHVSNF